MTAARVADVPRFTGEPCRWCDETPPVGEPKTRVDVASTVWFGACLNCWARHDNTMRPTPMT